MTNLLLNSDKDGLGKSRHYLRSGLHAQTATVRSKCWNTIKSLSHATSQTLAKAKITVQGQNPQTAQGASIILAGRTSCLTSNPLSHQRISLNPVYSWHFLCICSSTPMHSSDSSRGIQALQGHICFLLGFLSTLLLIMALDLHLKLQISGPNDGTYGGLFMLHTTLRLQRKLSILMNN